MERTEPQTQRVFPTRVGVNRMPLGRFVLPGRIPHACGGEPIERVGARSGEAYSPRVWG